MRVGWLGGSFDPVHDGHLHVARSAASLLDLETVWLVPAAAPPHKVGRHLAPPEDRLALLEIACRDDHRLQPHDLELRRDGLSYSLHTARALLDEAPQGTRLYAIIGADTLADLPHWHGISELVGLVTFCPVPRAGHEPDFAALEVSLGEPAARRIRDHWLAIPTHPASATAIRRALGEGHPAEHLPGAVALEIARRGLYGAGGASSSDSSGRRRCSP